MISNYKPTMERTSLISITSPRAPSTDIGADDLRIGNGSDYANLSVSFLGPLLIDAGDGANTINDVLGSNSFEFIPKIITSGTLTQTAAI